MADKNFGVKQINLIGTSGVPTIESPNNLNLNAINVAISTDLSIGGKVQSNIIVGNGCSVGIGTTIISSKLHVVGNTLISGNLNLTGLSTFIGITTSSSTIFANQLNVAGVTTFSNNVVIGGELRGPTNFIIDPTTVGDNTGAVRIKGDLYVDGAQFQVSSSTIELSDLRVGIATTVGTNLLLDGGGIGIGSANILKSFTYTQASDSLKSSENLDLASGKVYKIAGTELLSSTQLSVPNIVVSSGATVFGLSNLNQITETVVNNFNTTLVPSSGSFTIDTSLGTVFLGDLNASVTTWEFTNVPTTYGKATTVTLIINGDTFQTYGDACSVNGSAITNGVKWSGGTSPTSTDNYDIITFTIVRDNAGTINVFGSGNTNFS